MLRIEKPYNGVPFFVSPFLLQTVFMDPKWFPPPDRPFQPGSRSILAAGTIGITTLLIPKGQLRNIIAIPSILWILWILYNLRQHTTGKPEEDYLTAVNISITLARFIDVCVLHDAEQSLRRVRADGSDRETAEDIQRMGSRFVLEQALRAAYCFVYIDVHEWYMRRTPFGDGTTHMPDFFSLPLEKQIFLGWQTGLHNGFTMVFGYYLVTIFAVGAGFHSPQSWPPLFGSFIKKGYTVRNIWGYCWWVKSRSPMGSLSLTWHYRHQLLRRTFETANSSLTRLARIRKGTLASRYLQLYNAFVVSALIHHIGALNCPYSELPWCQFYFFMIQPVAITVEDFAIYMGKKAGLKESCKL
ncbi:hypothetical protein G647_06536 [Cladophialophora carrionii CBS 160.54]|uniref:Wax synthase domain-containing protein n=1 Tax=Cladophialophora carrionii CBS 160.54 TaxID=1279043 RepID=V9D754_9EURO|nr:uncharacterized protein G647_06536 [Cladophialophora carrionii CBS 160.54]ETI22461.1 hypothetical protein G647_06536 [Cladophialophora carrionii CBS 160.54]